MNRLFPGIVLALTVFALAGCPDDGSKNRIQPARTFAAPAKTIEKAHQMSRPIGCNGNPYYFNNETKEWYYYTMDGKAILSPNQPPCVGAGNILKHSRIPDGQPDESK